VRLRVRPVEPPGLSTRPFSELLVRNGSRKKVDQPPSFGMAFTLGWGKVGPHSRRSGADSTTPRKWHRVVKRLSGR